MLIIDFMSSEESDASDDEVIKVHPLPWRSERLSEFFALLDEKAEADKSPQAKRQMKERQTGRTSSRPKPTLAGIPWAFAESTEFEL